MAGGAGVALGARRSLRTLRARSAGVALGARLSLSALRAVRSGPALDVPHDLLLAPLAAVRDPDGVGLLVDASLDRLDAGLRLRRRTTERNARADQRRSKESQQ